MGIPANGSLDLHVPVSTFFLCPISLELMTDPVTLSSGQTFDRRNIQKWLDDGHSTCPVTRLPINNEVEELIPNHALRRLIQTWSVQNMSLGIQRIQTPRQPPSLKDVSHLLEQVRIHQSAVDDGMRRLSADALQKLCILASDRAKARLLLLQEGAPHVLSLFLSKWLPLCRRPSAPSLEIENALHLLVTLAEETEVGLHTAFTWEPACGEEVLALARMISDSRTKIELRRDAAILLSKSAASFECTRRDAGAMEGFMDAAVGLIREAPKDAMANLKYGSSCFSSLEYFSVAGLGLLNSVCRHSTKNRYLAVQAGALDAVATLLRSLRPDANTCPPSWQIRTIELSLKLWESLCKCADGRAASHELLGLLIGFMCNVSERTTKYCIVILWLSLKFAPIGSPLAKQVVQMGGFLKAMAIAQSTNSLKTRSLASKVANALSRSVFACDHLALE